MNQNETQKVNKVVGVGLFFGCRTSVRGEKMVQLSAHAEGRYDIPSKGQISHQSPERVHC